jgi:3-hydroxyisobutyrate dehydrogenase
MEHVAGTVPRVGIVGTGLTGSLAASRIAAAGFSLSVFDRRREALRAFADRCAIASSARAVAEGCDVIGVCVDDDEQVVDVVSGVDGLLAGAAPGATISVHSTIHPATCEVLARVAATQGVKLVDAPIVAEVDGSGCARTSLAVGGDAVSLVGCSSVFRAIADRVVYFGRIGSGMSAALLSNMLSTAEVALRHDAMALATELGLDEETMASLVSRVPVDAQSQHLQKAVGIGRRVVREFEADDSQLSSAAARGLVALAAPDAPSSSTR